MPSAFQRLKERKMVQWAFAYLAGAFAVVQGVEVLESPWGLSGASVRAIHVLILAGFFITLVIAWYHGEKGRQRTSGPELLMLAAVLAVAGVALNLVATRQGNTSSRSAPAGDDRPAIVVLPLENVSPRPEDEYFARGLHEQLTSTLSGISSLRVIARASADQYRDVRPPPRQIAIELGVDYVIGGSAQIVENLVQLTVSLIDGETEEQLWSNSFEREFSVGEVIAIQEAFASEVTSQLRARITPEEEARLAEVPTEDDEAYQYWLQARALWLLPGYLEENFEEAQRLYERAIELDPGFALARANLSLLHGYFYWFRYDRSEERLVAQRAEAEEALRLDPDLPQAHVAAGYVHYVNLDFQSALDDLSRALEGRPDDPEILTMIGFHHRNLGHWSDVHAVFDRVVQINPTDANLFSDLSALTYYVNHQYAEAVQAMNHALALAPDLWDVSLRKAYVYWHWQGQLDSVGAALARIPRDAHLASSGTWVEHSVILALLERDPDTALELLQSTSLEVFERQEFIKPRSLYEAWAHQMRGDSTAARAAFVSARESLERLAAGNPNDERIQCALGHAHAGLGQSSEAAAFAEKCFEQWREAGEVYAQPLRVEEAAKILAQAGLVDQALDHLEPLMEGPSWASPHTLRMDPIWDPLREHPRFQALVTIDGEGSEWPSTK